MKNRSSIPVMALLCVSSAATLVMCFALIFRFGFDPTNFFAMLVIPIGAIIFGMIAPLGAVAGARIAELGPGARLHTLIVGGALLAYTVYLLVIALMIDGANPAHPGVVASLLEREMDTTITFQRRSRTLGESGVLGGWGLAMLTLKFAGIAVGAWTLSASTKLMPYCRKCSVFTRKIDKGMIVYRSGEDWLAAMRRLPEDKASRASALLAMPRQGRLSGSGKSGSVRVEVLRHSCPICREQHMRERVFVTSGSYPVEQKQLRLAYSWTNAPKPPRPEPPQPVAAGGFGRKGL
ncbi:MAG: hypothetical protein R3E14_08285 [Erythrobacter sp.]